MGVDLWTQKEGAPGDTKENKQKNAAKTSKAKKALTPAELVKVEKLRDTDPAQKAWVGGLKPTASLKALEAHFAAAGHKPLFSHTMKGGTCVVLASEGDVLSAVAALNGSKFGGQPIEVDVWVKP